MCSLLLLEKYCVLYSYFWKIIEFLNTMSWVLKSYCVFFNTTQKIVCSLILQMLKKLCSLILKAVFYNLSSLFRFCCVRNYVLPMTHIGDTSRKVIRFSPNFPLIFLWVTMWGSRPGAPLTFLYLSPDSSLNKSCLDIRNYSTHFF